MARSTGLSEAARTRTSARPGSGSGSGTSAGSGAAPRSGTIRALTAGGGYRAGQAEAEGPILALRPRESRGAPLRLALHDTAPPRASRRERLGALRDVLGPARSPHGRRRRRARPDPLPGGPRRGGAPRRRRPGARAHALAPLAKELAVPRPERAARAPLLRVAAALLHLHPLALRLRHDDAIVRAAIRGVRRTERPLSPRGRAASPG